MSNPTQPPSGPFHYQQPGHKQATYRRLASRRSIMAARQQTNGKAIAALILGILSFTSFLALLAANLYPRLWIFMIPPFLALASLLIGIPAIILGLIAIASSANSHARQGRSLALAGMILGYVAMIGIALSCSFWFYQLTQALSSD